MVVDFNNGVVSVDHHFARFGSQSVAINKINTVDVRAHLPYGQGLPIVLAVLAIGFAWLAYSSHSAGSGLAALVLAALTVWSWRRHQIREYSLYLVTSASQGPAYATRDLEEVTSLRSAIEAAMIAFHDREMSVHHDVTLRRAGDDADDAKVIDLQPERPAHRRPRLLR